MEKHIHKNDKEAQSYDTGTLTKTLSLKSCNRTAKRSKPGEKTDQKHLHTLPSTTTSAAEHGDLTNTENRQQGGHILDKLSACFCVQTRTADTGEIINGYQSSMDISRPSEIKTCQLRKEESGDISPFSTTQDHSELESPSPTPNDSRFDQIMQSNSTREQGSCLEDLTKVISQLNTFLTQKGDDNILKVYPPQFGNAGQLAVRREDGEVGDVVREVDSVEGAASAVLCASKKLLHALLRYKQRNDNTCTLPSKLNLSTQTSMLPRSSGLLLLASPVEHYSHAVIHHEEETTKLHDAIKPFILMMALEELHGSESETLPYVSAKIRPMLMDQSSKRLHKAKPNIVLLVEDFDPVEKLESKQLYQMEFIEGQAYKMQNVREMRSPLSVCGMISSTSFAREPVTPSTNISFYLSEGRWTEETNDEAETVLTSTFQPISSDETQVTDVADLEDAKLPTDETEYSCSTSFFIQASRRSMEQDESLSNRCHAQPQSDLNGQRNGPLDEKRLKDNKHTDHTSMLSTASGNVSSTKRLAIPYSVHRKTPPPAEVSKNSVATPKKAGRRAYYSNSHSGKVENTEIPKKQAKTILELSLSESLPGCSGKSQISNVTDEKVSQVQAFAQRNNHNQKAIILTETGNEMESTVTKLRTVHPLSEGLEMVSEVQQISGHNTMSRVEPDDGSDSISVESTESNRTPILVSPPIFLDDLQFTNPQTPNPLLRYGNVSAIEPPYSFSAPRRLTEFSAIGGGDDVRPHNVDSPQLQIVPFLPVYSITGRTARRNATETSTPLLRNSAFRRPHTPITHDSVLGDDIAQLIDDAYDSILEHIRLLFQEPDGHGIAEPDLLSDRHPGSQSGDVSPPSNSLTGAILWASARTRPTRRAISNPDVTMDTALNAPFVRPLSSPTGIQRQGHE